MANILLSICIPTYKRAHYLGEHLDYIVRQFADDKIYRQVEIVISDNASPDDTKDLVAKYQQKYNNIRYYRNDINLGFDRNVAKAIYQAQGEFIWTLADDDFITDDALAYILAGLEKNREVSYVCLNCLETDYEHCPSGQEFFIKSWADGLTVSQNIFNRKYLPASADKYFDTAWLHYCLAKEITVNHSVLLAKDVFRVPDIPHPCEWEKGGNKFLFWLNLKIIIESLSEAGYDQAMIKKLVNNFAKEFPRTVITSRNFGLQADWPKFKMMVKEYRRYPFYLSLSILAFVIPKKLLNSVKKVWRLFFAPSAEKK